MADAIELTDELRRQIWEARRLADLSRKELGEAVGRSVTWMNRVELAQYDDRANKTITPRELRQIAAVTGRPLDWFVPPEQLADLVDANGLDERVAQLERDLLETRRALAAVAAAISLESLEAEQRQFLEDWQRHTPSTSAEGEPGTSIEGEG